MRINVMLGEHWYSLKSWRRHRLFRTYLHGGFSIGPLLISVL